MSKRTLYLIIATLLIAFIGVLFFLFTFPITLQVGLLLAGTLLLPVFIYQCFKQRGAMALFILFCTLGIMNTANKPFDLLFIIVAGTFFILKKQKLLALRNINFINYGLLLFMVITLLSVINSIDIRLGFSYFIHTLFMVVIFYFLALTIQTKKEFHSILWGYICAVFFSALAVIVQKLGLIGDIGTWFQGIRAQGFFMDPNDFSPFLILAIVLLIEKAFSYHYRSIMYFIYCFLAGILSLTLLASMSRAALLDLAIVLLVYFFYSLLIKKKFGQVAMLFVLTGLIVAVIIMVEGDSIQHYLTIRFSGSSEVLQNYDSDRFFYQLQGIITGSSNLFGIGPGQFENHFGYATHNLFIRIIAENGWIAFIAFAAVNLYLLTLLVYFRKKEVWNLPVYLFLSVYVGIIINSLFLDTLHWRYLWFYFGLCTIIINQAAKRGK
jgi:hypothetical protein